MEGRRKAREKETQMKWRKEEQKVEERRRTEIAVRAADAILAWRSAVSRRVNGFGLPIAGSLKEEEVVDIDQLPQEHRDVWARWDSVDARMAQKEEREREKMEKDTADARMLKMLSKKREEKEREEKDAADAMLAKKEREKEAKQERRRRLFEGRAKKEKEEGSVFVAARIPQQTSDEKQSSVVVEKLQKLVSQAPSERDVEECRGGSGTSSPVPSPAAKREKKKSKAVPLVLTIEAALSSPEDVYDSYEVVVAKPPIPKQDAAPPIVVPFPIPSSPSSPEDNESVYDSYEVVVKAPIPKQRDAKVPTTKQDVKAPMPKKQDAKVPMPKQQDVKAPMPKKQDAKVPILKQDAAPPIVVPFPIPSSPSSPEDNESVYDSYEVVVKAPIPKQRDAKVPTTKQDVKAPMPKKQDAKVPMPKQDVKAPIPKQDAEPPFVAPSFPIPSLVVVPQIDHVAGVLETVAPPSNNKKKKGLVAGGLKRIMRTFAPPTTAPASKTSLGRESERKNDITGAEKKKEQQLAAAWSYDVLSPEDVAEMKERLDSRYSKYFDDFGVAA